MEPTGKRSYATLRWRDDALELIDQRVLPETLAYVRCDDADAVAGAIRDMVVRGAPAIGCPDAYGGAVEAIRIGGCARAEFDSRLERAFDVLGASRPTAVNLAWGLARMRACLEEDPQSSPPQAARALLECAHRILVED